MTEAEYEAYRQAYERMHLQAEQQTTKKLLAELQREATADWKDNYEKMRAEVEAEINAQPIISLRHWLQYGVRLGQDEAEAETHRLDRDALVESFGLSILGRDPVTKKYLLPKGPRGVWQREGLDPEHVAKLWGFESGDAMVRELLNTKNRNDTIDEETQSRMKDAYGDILRDGTLPELALEAMENDAKGTFLIRQGRILARRAGAKDKPQGLARRAAQAAVAGKRIRDLSPHRYRLAEQRAARDVLDAVEAEDWQAAHEAGRKQLLNHFLVVEATKAKEGAAKGRTYLKRMDAKPARERIAKAGSGENAERGIDYFQQLYGKGGLLTDRFDLRSMTHDMMDRRMKLREWIASAEAKAEANQEMAPGFAISENIQNEDFRMPWRELTVAQFGELVDAVKNIEHLARTDLELLTTKRDADFARTREVMLDALAENRRTDEPIPLESRADVADRIRYNVQDYFASNRKFASFLNEFDGAPGGVFFDSIIWPMDEAGSFEQSALVAAGTELTAIFKRYMSTEKKVRETLSAATLGKVESVKPQMVVKRQIPGAAPGVQLSQTGNLVAVLNMGNEGNLARLIDGYGWSETDIEAIKDNLSKGDRVFVQEVWDFIDSFWPQIAAKEKRVKGVAPQKVEAQPLQFSDGTTLRGGYFPIVGDRRQGSKRGGADPMQEAQIQARNGSFAAAQTRAGFLKERAAMVSGQRFTLDFSVIFQHVGGVLHDIAWNEWLIDTNKIMRDTAIQRSIIQGYGHPVYDQLLNAVTAIAVGNLPASGWGEKALDNLRKGTAVSSLAFSATVSVLQPLGITVSYQRVGVRWVNLGIRNWMRGTGHMQSTVDWIMSVSPGMRVRLNPKSTDMQREMREIQSAVEKGGVFEGEMAAYFYFIVKMQMVADVPTWLGAYEKEMQIGSGDEKRAVAMADRAVFDTQGTGQTKDMSRYQREKTFKIFTMFLGFFNATENVSAEAVNRAGGWRNIPTTLKDEPQAMRRLAVDMLLLWVIPPVLSRLMFDALKQDYDEDETWAEYAGSLVFETMGFIMSAFPLLREFSSIASGYMDYDGPAGTRFFSATTNLIKQAVQGEADFSAGRAAVEVGGIVFKKPGTAAIRIYEGTEALVTGETKNPLAPFMGLNPEEKRRVRANR
jgi:hypothetical protein